MKSGTFVTCLALFAIAPFFSCDSVDNFDHDRESAVQMTDIDLPIGNTSNPQVYKLAEDREEAYTSTRKVIKEGRIAFTTKDVPGTEKFIKESIIQFEGYISSETIHHNEAEGKTENSIVVRIPANSFDKFLDAISSHAGQLDLKDIITKDVTEDYIDTDARIRSKKILEERYFELLKQGKNIDEILKVEGELANVRNEIELAQGHLNFLENKTSFSTLEITYYEPAAIVASTKTGTFGIKLKNAFATGWNVILKITIGLAAIWPLIIAAGVIALIVRRYIKKSGMSAQVRN